MSSTSLGDTVNGASPIGVQVKHLFKVYGPNPHSAIQQLKDGSSKEALMAASKHVAAVNDVSFSVAPGELFVIMGLSGSGKSTLIRCINRLIEPTQGQVLIDGMDICAASHKSLRDARLHSVAMVFQHFALFPHRTVIENVEFGLKMRGIPAKPRRAEASAMLTLVGLSNLADCMPDTLSGGMRQRVGLARALAVKPKVLLMDEPFSALDPITRKDLRRELLAIKQRLNTSIIFITHDIDEAIQLGDRIAIMKDGKFVQCGSGIDIVRKPVDSYVANFSRDIDLAQVLDAASIMSPLNPRSEALNSSEQTVIAESGDAFELDISGRPTKLLTLRMKTYVETPFTTVRGETEINKLYSVCRDGATVAVTDDSGRLCGTINFVNILRALADTSR